MIPRKSYRQLEKIAEDFLQKHGKFDGRMLLVELTVQALGYEIWPVEGLRKFAEAYVPNKAGIIFVDEGQMLEHPLRFRFTLAEELAHILIHVPFFESKPIAERMRIMDSITAIQYRHYEREAKYLADALLLRKSVFVERFRSHRAVKAETTANPLTVNRYVLRQIAMDFCVSPWAATNRAFKLKLITEAEMTELLVANSW